MRGWVKQWGLWVVLFLGVVGNASGQSVPSTREGKSGLVEALGDGVNMSSLQGAPDQLPGHLNGEVFVTPESHYRYYASKGMTHIRLEGSWERMQPLVNGALGEQLLEHYGDGDNPLRNPVKLVGHYLDLAEKHQLKVVLDLAHNYGSRYVGYEGHWKKKVKAQLGSEQVPLEAFVDYNVKLVKEFGGHKAVAGIELMNEPHDLKIGAEGWKEACQKAIDAIRAVDRKIIIFIDGYSWSSAEYWATNNPNLHKLKDPANRLVFTAHQYFDQSSQGIYAGAEAKRPGHENRALGSQRIGPFVEWIKKHQLQGHGSIGEFGAPNTAEWAEIVRQMVVSGKEAGLMLTAHEDVPYENDPYVMNLFPPAGQGDRYVVRLLESAKRGTGYVKEAIKR